LTSSISANLPSNEFTGRTVIVAGTWLLCVIGPALFAMIYGADYLFAVMAGCGVVIVLAWLRWSMLSSQRIGDRAVVCVNGALAAGLLCLYGLVKFNWPKPPAHSELLGLIMALALFILLPVRYILCRAQLIPNVAALMLVALALIPLTMLYAPALEFWDRFVYRRHRRTRVV
jgi:hypothetical protein